MRIVNPGPGELLDRLSILDLKITFGRGAGKQVCDFEQEQEETLAFFRDRYPRLGSPDQLPEFWKLIATNTRIWLMVDIVGSSGVDDTILAYAGKRAALLNAQRAEVIALLNRREGITRAEKL